MKTLILLFLPFITFGQTLQIQGQISDANTGTPLSFAHISLQDKGIGTLSNAEGAFELRLDAVHSNDSLVISYIGYKSATLSCANAINQFNTIQLQPLSQMLSEVIVKPIDGLTLIQEAIAKIPENYANEPHLKQGFYRVVSEDQGQYLHLSEAVFEIFLAEYGKKSKDQMRLLKARSVKDEAATHGFDLGLKPYLLFEYDMVSNVDHSELLSKRGLKNHKFEWKGQKTLQDRGVHEIWFDQREKLKKGLFQGKLYLDVETLAIIHIQYGYSPRGRQYVKFGDAATRALLGISGTTIDIEDYEFKVWYQQIEGKWYLSHAQNRTVLHFKNKRENYAFQPDIRVDYLVNKLDLENVSPFPNSETIGNGKLIQFQDKDTDPDFWKDYNIILADKPYEEIAKEIRARNSEKEE